ncbi:MAG: membrane integrity-associated transporter subunit PqiC [Xanthomonadales bacterium]|nr:membrane integrity-associated transporter subunit PqiC [Xanthomonadales bacterium]
MRSALRGLGLLGAMLLSGCASGPGIPDTTYFRLPEPAAPERIATPLNAPLVVETFLADGVHSDQAILYSTDPDGDRLRAYHYQLWVYPPTRMLQRRLIRYLDEAGAATAVLDRLPPRGDQYRLYLRIEAFERVRTLSGWEVRVRLDARLDQGGGLLPLIKKRYDRRVQVDEGIRDSVVAMGQVLDDIYAELAHDVAQVRPATQP